MKKFKRGLVYFALVAVFSSCEDAGTLELIDKGGNSQIEVFRYYYADNQYVYIARFRDTPNVVATTWKRRQGKHTTIEGNIVVFENDSIQVLLKR